MANENGKYPYGDNKAIAGVAGYWGDKMTQMAMEELAECSQAISKLKRKIHAGMPDGILTESERTDWINSLEDEQIQRLANAIAEMADVYISLKAVMFQYGISDADVMERVHRKLDQKY